MNMITDKDLAQYRDDGYCLIRNLIPAHTMAAMRARMVESMESPPPWYEEATYVVDPSVGRHPKGHPWSAGFQLPAKHAQEFAAVADHPNMVAVMTALLGGPVKRFTDQTGVRQGFITTQQGGSSFYHQDSHYWRIAPRLGCNCWIPMERSGRQAGVLVIKPGTHRSWTLVPHEKYFDDPRVGRYLNSEFLCFPRERIPFDQIDFSDEIVFEMEAGDALFFTNYTWHRSEPNRTGATQMHYAIAYQRV